MIGVFDLKKRGFILSFLIVLLVGCASKTVPPLKGSYQSEQLDEHIVQMAIQPEEKTFVEYISNREVDRGTYEKKSDDTYLFKSDKQEFEVILSPENSFDIQIVQVNEGEPIELKNVDKIPTYFTTEFSDVEDYEELLNEK